MCTVEVQDAQGRVLPITDNQVTFKVSGPGAVIGTGNGDPTNHEPDGAPARKAFAGLCMAIVQSTKIAGSLKIEAASPGLTAATATIASKSVKLRPQVPVWERQVPTGTGVTGLWRPAAPVAAAATNNPMALAGANADMVFTLHQEGGALTGSLESAAGGGFGGGGSRRPPPGRQSRWRQRHIPCRHDHLHRHPERRPHRVAAKRRLWRPRRPRSTGRPSGRCRPPTRNRSAAVRHRPLVRRRRPWRRPNASTPDPETRKPLTAGSPCQIFSALSLPSQRLCVEANASLIPISLF